MVNKMKYRLRVLKKFSQYANGVKRFFIMNAFIGLAIMALSFITPFLYKLFINEVILRGKLNIMVFVAAGYLGLFLTDTGLKYLKNYGSNRLVNRTLFRVKLKIWRGYFTMPFNEIDSKSIGDMKMRLDDDINQITAFSGAQSVDYLTSCVTLITGVVLLFLIEWRLCLFSIIAIPFTFWADHMLSKKERVVNESIRNNHERMSSWLHNTVQGWREIKAFNLQKNQSIRFVRFLHKLALDNAVWINYWVARVLIIPKIKDEFFMQFGLYFLGGLLIISGKMKIGDLLVFALYYNMVSGAVNNISSQDAELQANMPFTDRLLEELSKNNRTLNNKKIPNGDGSIELRNVTFTYPKINKSVLSNFNLKIKKGERVAIIGKSGSGKTTVLKLITGMLTPSTGNVIFSGVDLKEADLASIHRRIGFVMQENVLFNASIRENLNLGKPDASEDEMLNACRKANIYNLIKGMPTGLDTVIGERGIKLSGGQRQRMALARLFLRDVDIFIFDEATSALDQQSESVIHDAIRSVSEDKTIIVVAHRLSSVSLCNRQITV